MWHPYILSNLDRCIEVSLKIDENTLARELRHYAQVLIDLDLASQLPSYILHHGDLLYENLPNFYNACNSIGHAIAKCRIF